MFYEFLLYIPLIKCIISLTKRYNYKILFEFGEKMNTLKVTDTHKSKIIQFKGSKNLAELLIKNNVFIDRPCNGKGKCGKCAVAFISGAPKANKYDKNELSKKQLGNGYRLACKCIR